MWEIYVGLCVWSILLLAARSTPVYQNNYVAVRFEKLRAVSVSQHSRKELRNQHNATYRSIPKIIGEPACAAGETFCEHIDTYPDKHIKKILKEKAVPKGYFENKAEKKMAIVPRVGDLQRRDTSLCASKARIISPKVGKNKGGEWKYIINQEDGHYLQTVEVDICTK